VGVVLDDPSALRELRSSGSACGSAEWGSAIGELSSPFTSSSLASGGFTISSEMCSGVLLVSSMCSGTRWSSAGFSWMLAAATFAVLWSAPLVLASLRSAISAMMTPFVLTIVPPMSRHHEAPTPCPGEVGRGDGASGFQQHHAA